MVARRSRALELRIAGCLYRDIATQLTAEGLECSTATACRDVHTALEELEGHLLHQAARLRVLELARLESQTCALWGRRRDPAVSRALVAISQQRAKIAGLNAPLEIATQDRQRESGVRVFQDEFLRMMPDELLQQLADFYEGFEDGNKAGAPSATSGPPR